MLTYDKVLKYNSIKHLSFIICLELENEFKAKFLIKENFKFNKIKEFLNIISNRLLIS